MIAPLVADLKAVPTNLDRDQTIAFRAQRCHWSRSVGRDLGGGATRVDPSALPAGPVPSPIVISNPPPASKTSHSRLRTGPGLW